MSCTVSVLNKRYAGTVDPEGVVKAPPGSIYLNTATETLWAKKTGTGKTGWIQIIS